MLTQEELQSRRISVWKIHFSHCHLLCGEITSNIFKWYQRTLKKNLINFDAMLVILLCFCNDLHLLKRHIVPQSNRTTCLIRFITSYRLPLTDLIIELIFSFFTFSRFFYLLGASIISQVFGGEIKIVLGTALTMPLLT